MAVGIVQPDAPCTRSRYTAGWSLQWARRGAPSMRRTCPCGRTPSTTTATSKSSFDFASPSAALGLDAWRSPSAWRAWRRLEGADRGRAQLVRTSQNFTEVHAVHRRTRCANGCAEVLAAGRTQDAAVRSVASSIATLHVIVMRSSARVHEEFTFTFRNAVRRRNPRFLDSRDSGQSLRSAKTRKRNSILVWVSFSWVDSRSLR